MPDRATGVVERRAGRARATGAAPFRGGAAGPADGRGGLVRGVRSSPPRSHPRCDRSCGRCRDRSLRPLARCGAGIRGQGFRAAGRPADSSGRLMRDSTQRRYALSSSPPRSSCPPAGNLVPFGDLRGHTASEVQVTPTGVGDAWRRVHGVFAGGVAPQGQGQVARGESWYRVQSE